MNAVGTIRQPTVDEMDLYQAAVLAAHETMPYFAHGLFSMIPVAAPGFGTLGVDKAWRVYIDFEVLAEFLDNGEAGAVMLHEIGHLLRDHAGRRDGLPQPVCADTWNVAGDAEMNDDLIAAGARLPEWVVTPEKLGLEPGGMAEDYYLDLLAQRGSEPSGGSAGGAGESGQPAGDGTASDGEFGCGSGAGCVSWPGELADDDTLGGRGHGGVDEATGDLIRRRIAEQVRHAAASGRGSVPAGVQRWAESVLAPAVVRWERVLRADVRRVLVQAAGRVNYSYRRLSRHAVPGVVLPAMVGPSLTVAFVVDTSASVSESGLSAALSEIRAVIRSAGVARDRVIVLCVDAASASPQRVNRVQDIKLIGGGGTDMRVGIAAAEKLLPAPDVVITLTDGDTPWPERRGRAQLVCVIIDNPSAVARTPDFAITVEVPPERG